MTQNLSSPPTRERPMRLPRRRMSGRRAAGLIGNYGVLTAIAAVFVVPFLILLTTSLTPVGETLFSIPPQLLRWPISWDAYVVAFETVPMLKYLGNSFFYVITIVPLSAAVCVLAGYAFGALRFRGRNFYFMLILGTMFLPAEVMLIPRFIVVSELGLANEYLGVILPSLLTAFGTLIMRQAFAGIPNELRDAARIDGANEWRIFFNVMVPVVRPSLAIVVIFGFINVWNSFLWPLVVLNDEAKYPVALGVAYLAGIGSTDERSLAAGSVVSIIPIVIFFLIMQRHIMDGMKGAVKG